MILDLMLQQNIPSVLLTDQYQLTMGQAYFEQGKAEDYAIFNGFYRKAPVPDKSFVVFSGTELIISLLNLMSNEHQEKRGCTEFLTNCLSHDGTRLFSDEYIQWVVNTGPKLFHKVDINILREGDIVYPGQPFINVSGPLWAVQVLETAVLNILNFSSLITTNTMNICESTTKPVVDFGMRRAQGLDGSITASRAAYIGGTVGTSNMMAGYWYEIPTVGTHAHSFVMAHESELEAFRNYASAMPNNSVLLVDTYVLSEGIANAIRVGLEMKERGQRLNGIRIDSGHGETLCDYVSYAREELDAAGLRDTKIVVSNDLSADTLEKLDRAGADIYGIGTKLITSYECPALAGVYKLGAIELNGEKVYRYKGSASEPSKASLPGSLNICRKTIQHDIPHGSEDHIYDQIISDDVEVTLKNQEFLMLRPIKEIVPETFRDSYLDDCRERARTNNDIHSHAGAHFSNISNFIKEQMTNVKQ